MADPAVKVEGLAELRRALRKLEPELVPELRDALKKVAALAARDAQRRLSSAVAGNSRRKRPARSTGRAAASIRPVSQGNTISLAAGGARVPYYGWLDYGGDLKPVGGRHNKQARPFIKTGRFLYPAADAQAPVAQVLAEQAFDKAARKAGFD